MPLIETPDPLLSELVKRYSALQTPYLEAEAIGARARQTLGALNCEVEGLQFFLAARAMYDAVQPLRDEVQRVRNTCTSAPASTPSEAIRKSNILVAEELCSQAGELLTDCLASMARLTPYRMVRWTFDVQYADPGYFIVNNNAPKLQELTESVKALSERCSLCQHLGEIMERAESTRVPRSATNGEAYLACERAFEESRLAYRWCLGQLEPLLKPLFDAIVAMERSEFMEFVHEDVAVREICVAAARGLYLLAHSLFKKLEENEEQCPAISELYGRAVVRDVVELCPLPPPPTKIDAWRGGVCDVF